jgi:hypothetical protein
MQTLLPTTFRLNYLHDFHVTFVDNKKGTLISKLCVILLSRYSPNRGIFIKMINIFKASVLLTVYFFYHKQILTNEKE